MHEHAAHGAFLRKIGNQANRRAVGLECKLRRVVQHQQWFLHRGGASPRGSKVPAQDFLLGDPWNGKETIGGFGVGPVLTGQRDRLPKAIGH